jgi:NADP-dependent 3-hydroxy acid dehydrogenase YdfG
MLSPKSFFPRGFRVLATARSSAKIQHLKDLGCEIIVLDATDEGSVSKLVGRMSEKTGGTLHCLVNNAGMSKPRFSPSPPSHNPYSEWLRLPIYCNAIGWTHWIGLQ